MVDGVEAGGAAERAAGERNGGAELPARADEQGDA